MSECASCGQPGHGAFDCPTAPWTGTKPTQDSDLATYGYLAMIAVGCVAVFFLALILG